ncbi:MAG: M20 family metallopeptidase [bacterium JZ-2024 1]
MGLVRSVDVSERIAGLLERLIQRVTIASRRDELKAIIDDAEAFFSGKGLFHSRYEVNGKHSLVVTFRETRSPEIMFAGHLDVVDAEPEQYIPRREGDRLWGRGALDMKGPTATIMQLVADLADEGMRPDIGLMLTTDEEVGSPDGVAHLILKEGWGARFAIIPDGGEDFALVVGEKGALHFRVRATGKSAHGSRTWEGENALDKLVQFYGMLRSAGGFPAEPCGIPEHWHPTLNLGRINGGKKVNIVPDEGVMELDMRFPEPWTSETALALVQSTMAQFSGLSLEVTTRGEVVYTPPDNPYLRKFAEIVKQEIGRAPVTTREHGATDGRFFAEKGIPIIILYPVGGGIHSREEWVSVSSLGTLYRIFRTFVLSR